MKLEDIGFYTLCDRRALNASATSPLWRCELILTDRCNFSCPYCRGLREDCRGDLSVSDAMRVLDRWISQGLVNVRFSGGEPTLWRKGLLHGLVLYCSVQGVQRIAISTNGSAPSKVYEQLLRAGVNDFSISLDGGCCSVGTRMNGGKKKLWQRSIDNIKYLASITYVSVGMVFDENNIDTAREAIYFADSLGVSDIRVIPSAQYNKALESLSELSDAFLEKYPILKYRINQVREKVPVRGLQEGDCLTCYLALDDMAVAGKWHFPCIIHLREGGNPVGEINSPTFRKDREEWVKTHNSFEDPICKANCLDVCRDYNNKAHTKEKTNVKKAKSL